MEGVRVRLTGIDPDNPPGAVVQIFDRSRQRYGRVISPNLIMAHRPDILVAASGLGQAIDASKLIEPRLKLMACVRTAQMIGCPF